MARNAIDDDLLPRASERLERVWDSGSDHSAELAEINDTLADLTSLLGTGPYKVGTPQRLKLNERIEALAAPSSRALCRDGQPVRLEVAAPPARSSPTGGWERQDVTARNVWLRSMGIRLDFEYKPDDPSPDMRLDLGDLGTLTQQLEAGGPAVQWREAFEAMAGSGVASLELTADGVTVQGADGWKHTLDLPSDRPVAEQLVGE